MKRKQRRKAKAVVAWGVFDNTGALYWTGHRYSERLLPCVFVTREEARLSCNTKLDTVRRVTITEAT